MTKLTIRKKILFGFIVASLVPTFVLGFLNTQEARVELEMAQIESLDAIADLKKQRIEEFFQSKANDAVLVSQLDIIKNPLPAVDQNFNNRQSDEYKNAREILDGHLIPIRENKNLLEIILANPDGMMIYNTGKVHNDEELGISVEKLVSKDQFSIRPDVYVSDIFESPFAPSGFEMVTASPIYQNDGAYIGMAILAIDMGPVFDLILDTTGLGETGETLIGRSADDYALFINPLKYDPDAALKRQIAYNSSSDRPIREATQGLSGSGVTTDYRDENVVASWRPLDLVSNDLSWGLVAKIDTEEAFIASRNLIEHTIAVGFVMLAILIYAGIYFSRSIVKPLQEVNSATKKISKGNLKTRVSYERNDEVGSLGKSFNYMADKLAEAREVLDGKNKELQDHLSELQNKNTEIENAKKATLNILEDVQKEKENAQKEKERITTILDSIGDGVFVVDNNLVIQAINPVAANLSGHKVEDSIGKPYKQILNFVYEKDGKINDKFITNAIKTGKTQEMSNHTLLIRSDGSKIPVADSAAPLMDLRGEVSGCVVVFRDVSKEHAIDKAKTEFVSLASHQLRTPLAAINWNVELLLDDAYKKLSKVEKQSLDDIHVSGIRMTELVNALLNVSRIELGTFTVEPESTDIIVLIKDVLKDLDPRIKEKQLKLNEKYFSKEFVIDVDPKLMRMIIENLVSNAIKYTPDKNGINISLEKNTKEFVITVKDEGYGIPENQHSKIFTRLFRADNVRTKDVEGTGLGLYIVKSIVEHSGGKIWFDSKENKGTTFYVKLPLKGMIKKSGKKNLT